MTDSGGGNRTTRQPKGTTMMLTPKEVRNAELTVHRLREGCDTDEVDDLLDACDDDHLTVVSLTPAETDREK